MNNAQILGEDDCRDARFSTQKDHSSAHDAGNSEPQVDEAWVTLNVLSQRQGKISESVASMTSTDPVVRKAAMLGCYADLLRVRERFPKCLEWIEANKDREVTLDETYLFLNTTYMEECLLNSGAE